MGFPSPAGDYVEQRAYLRDRHAQPHPRNIIRLCRYRAVHQAGSESGSANTHRWQDTVCQGHG